MWSKRAPVFVNNNACTFCLSINNTSPCLRNTPSYSMQVSQFVRKWTLQTVCEHSLLHHIITQNFGFDIKHLHHNCLSISWSMVYIEEQEIKN